MDFTHSSVTTDTLSYISSVGTYFYPISLSADYTLSNVCVFKQKAYFDPFNNDYNYYVTNNDSISFIGHWANNGGTSLWEDHCTDFIKEITFPFSYLSTFVDTYDRFYNDLSGSDFHFVTGTNTVTADAYGTLITPDGITVQHVLRVHSVETRRDSCQLFGVTNETVHTYRWYSSDVKGWILSFQMTQNNQSILSADYQEQTNFNTSSNTLVSVNNPVVIYPNPNNGQFKILNPTNNEIFSIEVFNSVGQNVCSVNHPAVQNSVEIDLSKNSKGIYFVKVFTGEGVHVQKIIVQ
jgi:hypothetical protein